MFRAAGQVMFPAPWRNTTFRAAFSRRRTRISPSETPEMVSRSSEAASASVSTRWYACVAVRAPAAMVSSVAAVSASTSKIDVVSIASHVPTASVAMYSVALAAPSVRRWSEPWGLLAVGAPEPELRTGDVATSAAAWLIQITGR